MSYFTIHSIIVLVFTLVILIIELYNLKSLKRLNKFAEPSVNPKISVLIPARNEENNIRSCVESILNQDYQNIEVIVLNDNSEDKTREILLDMSAKSEKLRFFDGDSKPVEWSGKHWACHQLSKKASGELFLFIDTDTIHKPDTLKKAVSALYTENTDLLSVIPKQIVGTWSEKLVIPIMPWSISSFIPIGIAHKSKSPSLSLTVGQFMLFRRNAYEQSGGHESIKTEILDDIPIGRLIKKSGFKWKIVDGTKNSSCRMYNNFKEVYNGFSRNLFCAFNYNIPVFLWVWIWLTAVFFQPIITISLFIFRIPIPTEALLINFLILILTIIQWSIAIVRFKFPIYLIFLYTFSIILVDIIAIRSMYQTLTGKVQWKGRKIER